MATEVRPHPREQKGEYGRLIEVEVAVPMSVAGGQPQKVAVVFEDVADAMAWLYKTYGERAMMTRIEDGVVVIDFDTPRKLG